MGTMEVNQGSFELEHRFKEISVSVQFVISGSIVGNGAGIGCSSMMLRGCVQSDFNSGRNLAHENLLLRYFPFIKLGGFFFFLS